MGSEQGAERYICKERDGCACWELLGTIRARCRVALQPQGHVQLLLPGAAADRGSSPPDQKSQQSIIRLGDLISQMGQSLSLLLSQRPDRPSARSRRASGCLITRGERFACVQHWGRAGPSRNRPAAAAADRHKATWARGHPAT